MIAPWRGFPSRMRRSHSPTRRPHRHRARLRVEQLESRNLLSAAVSYTPSQILQAYGFNQVAFSATGQVVSPGTGTTAANGAGQTIAIVDAFSDPNLVSDVAAFDTQFSLPGTNAAGVNSFLSQVNQSGNASPLPAADAGWGLEMSLDVEWAHAAAPGAKILLVQANSDSLGDLLSAVKYAADAPGVSVVSMSWGANEFRTETKYDGYFTTPSDKMSQGEGVTFVAASGDSGALFGPDWPAASPNVVGVGGTTLNIAGGTETGWGYGAIGSYFLGGSGGGVSRFESQPSYQGGVVTQSKTRRTSPDVAYDADPNTGFQIVDTFGTGATSPFDIGGTSAGAPQWAALVAIADQGRALQSTPKGSLDGPSQTLPTLYANESAFRDITSGTNGYHAGPGYDLVTGLGTPVAGSVIKALVKDVTVKPAAPAGPAAPQPAVQNAPRAAKPHAVGGATSAAAAGQASSVTGTATAAQALIAAAGGTAVTPPASVLPTPAAAFAAPGVTAAPVLTPTVAAPVAAPTAPAVAVPPPSAPLAGGGGDNVPLPEAAQAQDAAPAVPGNWDIAPTPLPAAPDVVPPDPQVPPDTWRQATDVCFQGGGLPGGTADAAPPALGGDGVAAGAAAPLALALVMGAWGSDDADAAEAGRRRRPR